MRQIPRWATAFLMVLASDLSATEITHPSFDCLQAKTIDEAMICTDRELTQLDLILSQTWNTARKKLGETKATEIATAVLRARRACEDKVCIRQEQVAGARMYQLFGIAVELPGWATSELRRAPEQFVYDNGFPLSCKGWNGSITTITGVNTRLARMTGVVKRTDIMEYCLRDPGGETILTGGKHSVGQCVDQNGRDTIGTILTSVANCEEGTIRFSRDTDTVQFTLIRSNEPGGSWVVPGNSEPESVGCANGTALIADQFQILCPDKWRKLVPSGAFE